MAVTPARLSLRKSGGRDTSACLTTRLRVDAAQAHHAEVPEDPGQMSLLQNGTEKSGSRYSHGLERRPLHLYEKHYEFSAQCRRPDCEHTRDILVAMLLRRFQEISPQAKSRLVSVAAITDSVVRHCEPTTSGPLATTGEKSTHD